MMSKGIFGFDSKTRVSSLYMFVVAAALSPLAHAQGGPVSPPLLPSFTKDPEIVPVPSVDPDFLVHPKSFVYDPTGANVFANALNPETSPAVEAGARGQLDLSLRDATQAGRSGPQSASRLSALEDDSDSPDATIGLGGRTSRQTGYGMSVSNADFDAGEGGEPNSIYHSSWSGGSASQFQSSGSNWGVKPMRVQRMGLDMSTAASNEAGSSGMISGFQTGSMAGANGMTTAGRGGADGLSNTPLSNGLAMGPGAASSRYGAAFGAMRGAGASAMPGMGTISLLRQGGNAAFATESDEAASANGPGSGKGRTAMASAMSAPQTFERLMVFSPQSYAGYSFGMTPFAATPSFSDETFLKPNIFAITLPALSSRTERKAGQQQALGEGEGLATSATHYGMASNLGAEATRLGGRRHGESKRKNPYLGDSGLISTSSQ